MQVERRSQSAVQSEQSLEAASPQATHSQIHTLTSRAERYAGTTFVMPAVIVVLVLSIFPLIISLYLSLSNLKFVKGGFELSYVGLAKYRKLLFGSEQSHLLGVLRDPGIVGWFILGLAALALGVFLVRYVRGDRFSVSGLFWRIIFVGGMLAFVWLLVHTLGPDGRPGTLVVTLIYVFAGISLQYALGLGLAMLTTQRLPGRRFFRVVFLLPMMITPVGVAYMFRMLTDTNIGPFNPIWYGIGLGGFSWVNDPWGARIAILIGDTWQWTPFMFIVLLAALEGQAVEPFEAAIVDGATSWQIFRYITWPEILPVSTTLVLIRMIEAFKIIDLPNVMTGGGPGTATEPLTLHSFIAWRTLDLGGSAAIAYLLLFVVTFFGISFVNLLRSRASEAAA